MVAEVVQLYDTSFRCPAETLRNIADEIDAGQYGEVGSLGLVILGDKMEVFRAGKDAEAPSIALLLHAGFLRLSRSIEEFGRT